MLKSTDNRESAPSVGGALRGTLLALGIVAVVGALVAMRVPHADGQTGMMIGIDMQTAGNQTSSVKAVQPCTSVEEGDEFTADVFIANVQGLTSWELRLDYDPDVIQLLEADYEHFLLSAQPAGGIFAALFEQEQPGRHFLAATEIRGTPDSGSGILARVTFSALKDGDSPVGISTRPGFLGPRVTGRDGAPLGDSNGDGVWDEQTSSGQVVVGDSCVASTPVRTPAPNPGGTATPRPDGSTPPAGGDANNGPDATNAPESNEPDAPGGDDADDGEGDGDGDDGGQSGEDGGPGTAGGTSGGSTDGGPFVIGIDGPGDASDVDVPGLGDDAGDSPGAGPDDDEIASEDEDGDGGSTARRADAAADDGIPTALWLAGGLAMTAVLLGAVLLLRLRYGRYT